MYYIHHLVHKCIDSMDTLTNTNATRDDIGLQNIKRRISNREQHVKKKNKKQMMIGTLLYANVSVYQWSFRTDSCSSERRATLKKHR